MPKILAACSSDISVSTKMHVVTPQEIFMIHSFFTNLKMVYKINY